MHCKSYSHFFCKKFQHICVSLDVNFNESLTNDIVSFEQLGPAFVFAQTVSFLFTFKIIPWLHRETYDFSIHYVLQLPSVIVPMSHLFTFHTFRVCFEMPYRRFEKVIKKNDDEIFQTGFIVISLCPFFSLFFNFIFNIENSI